MWNAMLNTIHYSKYHTLCLHKHMAKYWAKLMFIKQIPKALSCIPYFTILPNCRVDFPLWIAWMSFKLLTKINFWAVQGMNVFSGFAQTFAQEYQTALFCLFVFLFFLPAPRAPSVLFPSFSLSFFVVIFLLTWWVFGACEEPFQNSNHP